MDPGTPLDPGRRLARSVAVACFVLGGGCASAVAPGGTASRDCGACSPHRVIAIGANGAFTCALVADGTVRCWGAEGSHTPAPVPGLQGVVGLALGGETACALIADGTVQCWGLNAVGSEADGGATMSPAPEPVPGIERAVDVGVGGLHACAVLADHTVRCWGTNVSGRLGDGTTDARTQPVVVATLSNAVQVAPGMWSTCARLAHGTVDCWGDDTEGELGTGRWTDLEPLPVPVTDLAGALAVVASPSAPIACAIVRDASVRCWGGTRILLPTTEEVGLCPGPPCVATPTVVPAIAGVRQLAVGRYVACALLMDGSVSCWGNGAEGVLGDGTMTSRRTPAPVASLRDVVQIALTDGHACALRSDGSVWCWGRNASGALGDGTTMDQAVPQRVVGL